MVVLLSEDAITLKCCCLTLERGWRILRRHSLPNHCSTWRDGHQNSFSPMHRATLDKTRTVLRVGSLQLTGLAASTVVRFTYRDVRPNSLAHLSMHCNRRVSQTSRAADAVECLEDFCCAISRSVSFSRRVWDARVLVYPARGWAQLYEPKSE